MARPEVRGSKFREPRTSDLEPSPVLRVAPVSLGVLVARLRCRLDVAVGRQFRASQVGGEQRLNLAAQCVLNLIRRFSGIDHFEVKLFRHFVELLDQEGLVLLKAIVEIAAETKIHP
jgi:hypothetical protein